MFYHIERTLEFLPGIACTILVLVFLFLEVKNVKEQLRDKPVPEPGRGSFIPPEGEGYEYYISNSTIVYVLRKAKNRFRIYLIQGQSPAVNMKHDRYGNYFTIRCKDTGTAEKIVDKAFGLGMNV